MKLYLSLIFIFLALTETAQAEETAIYGIFSSFHKNSASGDLIGAEIHVLPHPAIVVQGSEGHAGEPELFKVKVLGNNLLFTIPEASKTGFSPGFYEATITKDKMVLVGPRHKIEIPRNESYWK